MTVSAPSSSRPLQTHHWGSLATSIALALILSIGPLILGGFRIWLILPIVGAAWLLVFFQGARLLWNGPSLPGRFGDGADLFVFLFLGYSVFRYFTTPVEYLARIEVLEIFAYAAVFWICRYGFSRKPHVLYLLTVLAILGIIVAATGYLFRFQPSLRPFGQDLIKFYMPRFFGTYGCPNHFGALVVMTLSIVLSFCFLRGMPWIIRITGLYMAVIMAVAVGLSGSRGSWLGLVTCLLIFAVFLTRHGYLRWYWTAIGLTLAVGSMLALFFLSPFVQERLRAAVEIVQKNQLDGYVRIVLARDALRISHDYPLFGTGPATFIHMHMRYQDAHYVSQAQYTHNDYLNLLADYGLVGVLLALGFIVCVTRQLFRNLGPLPDRDEAVILCAALCAWCALLVHSVVDFNMHIPGNALILFALAGVGLRRSAAHAAVSTGWLRRAAVARPLGALLILMSLGAMAATVYTARGYYPYILAEERFGVKPEPLAFEMAQKAVNADPRSPLALKYLADLYRHRAAAETDVVKRAPDAHQASLLYARAYAVNPLNDELFGLQGLSYDLMGRYPEAYLIHTAAIKKQPYNGYFHLLLGLHFWRRGMLVDAQRSFQNGARCPNVSEDNRQALAQINRVIEARRSSEAPLEDHEPTVP